MTVIIINNFGGNYFIYVTRNLVTLFDVTADSDLFQKKCGIG